MLAACLACAGPPSIVAPPSRSSFPTVLQASHAAGTEGQSRLLVGAALTVPACGRQRGGHKGLLVELTLPMCGHMQLPTAVRTVRCPEGPMPLRALQERTHVPLRWPPREPRERTSPPGTCMHTSGRRKSEQRQQGLHSSSSTAQCAMQELSASQRGATALRVRGSGAPVDTLRRQSPSRVASRHSTPRGHANKREGVRRSRVAVAQSFPQWLRHAGTASSAR